MIIDAVEDLRSEKMRINNTNLVILIAFLSSLCFFVIGCSNKDNGIRQNRNEFSTIKSEDKTTINGNQLKINNELVAPVVELSMASEATLNQPLKIHWKITNPNAESVYIYTSLLQEKNSVSVEFKINKSEKMIDLIFTRLSKIILEPNYFPKTEFTKIEAGKSLEGDLKSKLNLFEEMKRQTTSKESSKSFTGEWSVKGIIAFGDEIDSVKKVIDNTKNGHPIDPIIDWQKTTTSKTIKVFLK
jgi:hypothetical protein